MNSTAAVPTARPASTRERAIQAEGRERLFYLLACLVMIAGVAIGFRLFYLRGLNDAGQPVTPQITALVFLHGGLMTGWMLFFLLQCSLVATGSRRLHMRLGRAGIVLYVLIVPIAAVTALLQIHYADPASFPPFGPYRFLVLPLTEITNFTLFIGAAFLSRRNPALHRALMTIGTLSIAQAGIGRIGSIRNMFFQASHAGLFFTFWGSTIVTVLLLWLLKVVMTRRWDRYFATAVAFFVGSGLMSSYISTTTWWLELSHWMTRSR